MSNYVQTTFFTPKDSLPPSNPAKTIFGAAYDVEFGNISSAIASKYDSSSISAGPIAFALGSAATPSVTFLGELGTGLYSNVSGDLGHATAGTARLTISGSTGLTTALAGLTVSGGTTTTAALSSTTGNFSQNVVIGAPSSGTPLTLNTSASGNNFLTVSDGTQSGAILSQSGNIQFGALSNSALYLFSNNTNRVLIAANGAVTINAPGSGVALTINGISNSVVAAVGLLGITNGATFVNGTAEITTNGNLVDLNIGTAGGTAVNLWTTGAKRVAIAAAGSVTINAPASGVGLTVNAVSGNYAGVFNAPATGSSTHPLLVQGATSGTSNGIFVQAGLVSTDSVCYMRSASGSQNFFDLYGDGHLTIGGPSGTSIACSAAGNVSIAAPSSGVAFSVTGVAGTHSTTITDSATNSFNAGFLEIPQVSKSAAYTTVLSDSGKHIYHPSADTTARTWTIASNASVPYPIGTAITFDNDTGAGVITLAITTDTLVWLPAGSTGSRSIAAGGQATALKVTATRWHLTGVGIT